MVAENELVHQQIDPTLLAAWVVKEQSERILTILGRSAGELIYYPSECQVLSAAALENLPSSNEKHAARIAAHIPGHGPSGSTPIPVTIDPDAIPED